MRALIVASKFAPEYSGPGSRIPSLYEAIGPRLGLDRVDVYCNGIELASADDYDYRGLHVKRRTMGWIRQLRPLPERLRNTIAYCAENIQAMWHLRHWRPGDVAYVHIIGHSGGTAAALWWARRCSVPVLLELVTSGARPCQRFLLFSTSCPQRRCRIVALTRGAAQRCIESGFTEADVWQRPNPVEEDRFYPDLENRSSWREALLPFDDSACVICSVAKWMPQKNQLLLVEALARMPESCKLVLAGPLVRSGPLQGRDEQYLDELRQRVERHGLGDRVHLVVDHVDAAAYMKAADVYAMPAWNEGLGTPMLEAMACGLPVVANSGETAFTEWIKDGENGYLCDIDDPRRWASALQQAAAIPAATRLAAAARVRASAGHHHIHEVYAQVIGDLSATAD